MKGIFCNFRAKQFHSVSICRAFYYLRNKNRLHQQQFFKCHYYECRLMSLFNRILVERKDQQYLFVIIVNNYDMFDDVEILRRLILLDDDWH